MSKWFSLSVALVVIATSCTARAQGFTRFSRLIAEEQPAPAAEPAAQAAAEPAAPAEAEPAPEPSMEAAPMVEGYKGAVVESYGKGGVTYGYPFANGCGGTPSCCDTMWNGYVGGRHCGRMPHRCGWRSACATPTYCPSVNYGCGSCGDPCNTSRGCGLFARWHAKHQACGVKGGGCDYGWGGYGSGYTGYYGYGFGGGYSSGCSSCGSSPVIKGDAIEAAPKEAQPLDAPVIENKSALWQFRSSPRVVATGISH